MKLKIFDQINVPSTPAGKSGKPAFHITKNGIFTINKFAAEALNLTPESKIKLAQDEKEPTDWYVFTSEDVSAFTVRKKGVTNSFIFNSSGMGKLIFEALKVTDKSIKVPMACQPQDFEKLQLFALLTKAVGKK